MSINQLRIVFIGTPDFAVCSLKSLINAKLNVVAVVTVPDKPAGRGLHIQYSPVKQFALDHQLPVLQPIKLKALEFIEELKTYHADLQVVVAFRMLPEVVWNMPPLGTFNVHASLLPQYRGAAPINWAIINGEHETGVTTFKLKHEIDTGDILLQQKIMIEAEDNAGTLHDKLMIAGAQLLLNTIFGIAEGTIKEQPQIYSEGEVIKIAPKLFKTHQEINWEQTAEDVHNLIRGLSPHPGAITTLKDKVIKIYKSRFEVGQNHTAPGIYEITLKHELRIATTDGWVYIEELQQEGKKRMDVVAFLRGFRD